MEESRVVSIRDGVEKRKKALAEISYPITETIMHGLKEELERLCLYGLVRIGTRFSRESIYEWFRPFASRIHA